MKQLTSYKLQAYYANKPARALVNTVYIINELALTIYLFFIPIQIAYFWKIKLIDNGSIQTAIDISVLIFFLVHVGLYFDEKLYEWMKSPYTSLRKKILTFQFIYDVICVFLAIYAVILVNQTVQEQIVELMFIGKVYKLVKFDLKCMYIVIGTKLYLLYKMVRTLLILAMVISYVGSLFYGIAYLLLNRNIQYYYLLWIYDTPAISDLVSYPFIIQLEYAMYWALGTASTAAYGDISASQPVLVFINILALAFEGFLFGFYLNSMHSIPIQSKERQADLLQKFDAFQQHASNRKISKKLYLQILCSLQYSESQKKKMHEIQKFLPKKYLQQIKYSLYSNLLDNPIFFSNSNFQHQLSEKVIETVSEKGEDVYNYRKVNKDDLLYLKEGVVRCYIAGQLKSITVQIKQKGEYFGVFGFITGLLIPQKAICSNYCFLEKIAREDYKKLLPQNLKLQFNQLQLMAFKFEGAHLTKQPIVKFIKNISQSDSKFLFLFNLTSKQKMMIDTYRKSSQPRGNYARSDIRNRHFFKPKQLIKSMDAETQTQAFKSQQFQKVYLWGYNSFNLE